LVLFTVASEELFPKRWIAVQRVDDAPPVCHLGIATFLQVINIYLHFRFFLYEISKFFHLLKDILTEHKPGKLLLVKVTLFLLFEQVRVNYASLRAASKQFSVPIRFFAHFVKCNVSTINI
jgi:hypothetical protein